MNDFEPELGQMLFGNPWKSHKLPAAFETTLEAMLNLFDVANPKADNPFSNSGARWAFPSFEVHAYDWGAAETEQGQPWNLKWRDLEVSWYKWCGRGASANRRITRDEALAFAAECVPQILNRQGRDLYDG